MSEASAIFIGDFWNEDERNLSFPFVSSAGAELFRILHHAGWHPVSLPYNFISPISMKMRWRDFPFQLLNVFNAHPKENQVESFYASASDNLPICRDYPFRRFGSSNKFVRAAFASHIEQLHEQLHTTKPNLIIALGGTACWALGLGANISKLRGTIHQTAYGKVLPTYHPTAILRNWSLRVITVLDLFKARRESTSAGITLTPREIWAKPAIDDLWEWWTLHGKHSQLLAFDIETIRRAQISEIGFASDPYHALHIPFRVEQNKEIQSYWKTLEEEVEAWKFVKHVCESDVKKIAQNAQYDTYYLAKEVGIAVKNLSCDTLQAMHCFQPEWEKSLGFMASVFCDEQSWKQIRTNTLKDND